ncbi:MAG: hypothetical protein ACRDL5_05605 [Solirubrobacteraceae bacterium]
MPVQKSTSSEELAYMLLEEARLRCPPLLDDGDESHLDLDGLSLHGLYSDLGTAGYYASARLDPARRRQLLAQAHARSERHGVGERSLHALADVTAAATRMVERALTVTRPLDHMHLAHIYVMSASEALDAMSALPA